MKSPTVTGKSVSSAMLNGSKPSAILEPGDDDGEAQRVESGLKQPELVGQRCQILALLGRDLFDHGNDLRPC